MKAKIKLKGEIIDVISWSASGTYVCFINAHREEEKRKINYYKDIELFDSIDWEQRRYEIAKDIYASDVTTSAEGAVSCADELIAELKKQKP